MLLDGPPHVMCRAIEFFGARAPTPITTPRKVLGSNCRCVCVCVCECVCESERVSESERVRERE